MMIHFKFLKRTKTSEVTLHFFNRKSLKSKQMFKVSCFVSILDESFQNDIFITLCLIYLDYTAISLKAYLKRILLFKLKKP